MNTYTPNSILAQALNTQADKSIYAGNVPTLPTKITLPKEAVEMARSIDAMLLKQFAFLWAGKKHATLTDTQMLGKVAHSLARLKPYCEIKNGGTGSGYPDTSSEFAETCLTTWSSEYIELKARLSQ